MCTFNFGFLSIEVLEVESGLFELFANLFGESENVQACSEIYFLRTLNTWGCFHFFLNVSRHDEFRDFERDWRWHFQTFWPLYFYFISRHYDRLDSMSRTQFTFFPNRGLVCFLRYDRVGNVANIIVIHEDRTLAWNLTFFLTVRKNEPFLPTGTTKLLRPNTCGAIWLFTNVWPYPTL